MSKRLNITFTSGRFSTTTIECEAVPVDLSKYLDLDDDPIFESDNIIHLTAYKAIAFISDNRELIAGEFGMEIAGTIFTEISKCEKMGDKSKANPYENVPLLMTLKIL